MILISSILFSKRCAKIGKVNSLLPIYKVKNVESVTDSASISFIGADGQEKIREPYAISHRLQLLQLN